MKGIGRIISIVFTLLLIIIQLMPDSSDDSNREAHSPEDYSSPLCTEQQLAMHEGLQTSRSWHDYAYKDFCTSYYSEDSSYRQSLEFRRQMHSNPLLTENRYWYTIYNNLYYNDFDKLKPLADSLIAISEARGLNRNEFANMVVTFVQDIPYSFIKDGGSCAGEDPGFDCVNNQRFGLLGPVEFLHTLKGDCDTRTVLLYTLLKHFNYSPIIVNSWKYLHSMLLLDVATSGSYLEHKGQYFYFWETTAKGWQAGDMPPDMTDLKSWQIILD